MKLNKGFILFLIIIFCGSICKSQNGVAEHPDIYHASLVKNISDSNLVELVQKQTFKYFWNFAHPVSGMARERSNNSFNYGDEVVTTGGTGFGIMGILVAAERKWISRDTACKQIRKILTFLSKANSYHGVFPHWLNGATGKVIPFSRKDDGADLVETAYLFQGLLCARQYFNNNNNVEDEVRNRINSLWNEIEWNWLCSGLCIGLSKCCRFKRQYSLHY